MAQVVERCLQASRRPGSRSAHDLPDSFWTVLPRRNDLPHHGESSVKSLAVSGGQA